MSKTSKTITYSDKVKFKDTDGSSNDVYVIKDKNGKAIWQRGKVVTISTNGHMTVEATKVDIDNNTTRQTASSPYIVRAGERVTFSATPNVGYELTSSSAQQYNLNSLNNLGESSFTASTVSFTSRQSTIVTTLNINYLPMGNLSFSSSDRTVTSGGSITFTIIYDDGYGYESVVVEGSYGSLVLVSGTTKQRTYRVTNVTSSLIITATAKSLAASSTGIENILNINDALFEKFDPNVVQINLIGRNRWIIEPIEPIYDGSVTFKITPTNILDELYAPLPSGIQISSLSEGSHINCAYFIQPDEDGILCGYIKFAGTLAEADVGAAQLVFAPFNPRINLVGISSTGGSFDDSIGYISSGAVFTGSGCVQGDSGSGGSSIPGTSSVPITGEFFPGMDSGIEGGISYSKNGTTKNYRSTAFDITSDDYINVTTNESFLQIYSPKGSFWATRNGKLQSSDNPLTLPDGAYKVRLNPAMLDTAKSEVTTTLQFSLVDVPNLDLIPHESWEQYLVEGWATTNDPLVSQEVYLNFESLADNETLDLRLLPLGQSLTSKIVFNTSKTPIPVHVAIIPHAEEFVEELRSTPLDVQAIQNQYLEIADLSLMDENMGIPVLNDYFEGSLLVYVTEEDVHNYYSGGIDPECFFDYSHGLSGLMQYQLDGSGYLDIQEMFQIDKSTMGEEYNWAGFTLQLSPPQGDGESILKIQSIAYNDV